MFCIRCEHHVIECTCADIEQRLRHLCTPADGAGALAAAANLRARALAQSLAQPVAGRSLN
jgi:hypothetical protein